MKYAISIISLVLIFGISGCGYKEGVATASQKSYLYFNGSTDDITVSIDGGDRFDVKEGKANQYAINPGKHLVEVYRNNNIIVKREIFVSDGVAKEIEVK
jgi:outer membrane usher protein FimD/PapC